MNFETDDINILAAKLTEEFLLKFNTRLTLYEKRDLRLQSLPYLQEYLQHDVACGLKASAFFFRTALKEDTQIEHIYLNLNTQNALADFLESPKFETLLTSLDFGVHSARKTRMEVAKAFTNNLHDFQRGLETLDRLCNNELTSTQDRNNYNILRTAAFTLCEQVMREQFRPLDCLENILSYATQCQHQLTPSAPKHSTEAWVTRRRDETAASPRSASVDSRAIQR